MPIYYILKGIFSDMVFDGRIQHPHLWTVVLWIFSKGDFYDGQPCDFDLGFGLPLGENKSLCQFPMNQF